MKTTILFIFMSVLTCTINAGDSKYREAMAKSLEKLNHALSREDFQACGSGFERIALAEKNRWLPYYYASYAWIMVSFSETDPNKKDPILERLSHFSTAHLHILPMNLRFMFYRHFFILHVLWSTQ